MQTQSHIIETKDLTKIYGDGAEVRALDGVSIQIQRGEFLTVMGPSGSGKSTLLNLLGALDKPSSGHVFINGQDLAKVRDLDRFRARTVGFVFQLHNLIPHAQRDGKCGSADDGAGRRAKQAPPVSYTHLTLPTKRIV